MLELSCYDTQIVLLAKGHYDITKKEGIKILYEEIYEYDWDVQGAYHMVWDLFFKIWQVRGFHERELCDVMHNSMPSENWKVGGKGTMLWNKDMQSFNDSETYFARILAMISYISLTEIKFLKLMPKEQIKHYLPLKHNNPIP